MRDGGREDWREGQTDPFPAAEIRRLETGTGLGRNDFAVQTTCHRQSDLPGPRQGVDPEGVHQLDEFLHFAGVTRDLDGQHLRGHINDLAPENGAEFDDFRTRLGINIDLQEDKFALNGLSLPKINDGDDVNQLIQLLDDLVDNFFILRVDHQGHARDGGVVAGSDVQRVDIKSTAAEHPGHAGQDAKFVFDEDGDGVAVHISVAYKAGKGLLDWPLPSIGQPKSPNNPGPRGRNEWRPQIERLRRHPRQQRPFSLAQGGQPASQPAR